MMAAMLRMNVMTITMVAMIKVTSYDEKAIYGKRAARVKTA